MDIKLNGNHDILFDGTDCELTKVETESLSQRLKVKLMTFQGEWFLDVNEGIPYFQSIFGKNRAKETIDAIFKRAILGEPEVLSILSFYSEITPERHYQLQFTVKSSSGEEGVPVELLI